jgi:hypothetical protein
VKLDELTAAISFAATAEVDVDINVEIDVYTQQATAGLQISFCLHGISPLFAR